MTIVRAPGKVVLSGAYAVLEGAPAIVAAVGRDVIADSDREAERVTEEVQAAIDRGILTRACWFDASALRSEDGTRKLGLGSSAAILVATMAAVEGLPDNEDDRAQLTGIARQAHRAAQGGGSGVDVAASAMGGVLVCLAKGGALDVNRHALPEGAVVTILACAEAASTAGMLAQIRALRARDMATFRRLLDAACAGANAAVDAKSPEELIAALVAQRVALAELGEVSGAPIVTAAVAELAKVAGEAGAYAGPAGAGGGDVALLVTPRALDLAPLLDAARAAGLTPLEGGIGAPGVYLVEEP
jgi:phosphomevalonate kinase